MAYQLLSSIEVSPSNKTVIPATVDPTSLNLRAKGGHWARVKIRKEVQMKNDDNWISHEQPNNKVLFKTIIVFFFLFLCVSSSKEKFLCLKSIHAYAFAHAKAHMNTHTRPTRRIHLQHIIYYYF